MATATPLERSSSQRAQAVSVQVLACVPAARDAVTLQLAMPGTRRAPAPYSAGQFITLAFRSAERTYYRSYSLCGDGRRDAPWEITVKRHDKGVISTYLCQRARPGMVLQSSLPQGSFTLPEVIRPGAPLVFVAGGSGITPIYAMLRALARLAPAQRPRVWLHYAYHSPEDAIYGRELAELDPQRQWLTQRQYVTTRGNRLRAEAVLASLGTEAQGTEWYICGPEGLKRALEAEAKRREVPAQRLHMETFASPHTRTGAAAGGAGRARVRIAESGAILATQPGETLIETLERHGYSPEFSCRAGACGSCRLRLLAGQVRNGDGEGLSPRERAAGYVLSCVGEPVGDVTLSTEGVGLPMAGRAGGKDAAPGARGTKSGRMARSRGMTYALRASLAAAALGLFIHFWGLTSHGVASLSGSTTTSTSSGTSSSASNSSNSSSSSSNSSSGTSSSGSSGISTSTGQSGTNSSTGVS